MKINLLTEYIMFDIEKHPIEKDQEVYDLAKDIVIVDCCITNPTAFWVLGVQDMGEGFDPWSMYPPVRAIGYRVSHINGPLGPWGFSTFEKNTFKNPMIVPIGDEQGFLIADFNGMVHYNGWNPRDCGYWEKNGIDQRGIAGLKNIHGTIYAVGLLRSVFRRDGKDQWIHISQALSRKTQKLHDATQKTLWTGFNCIDGFEADRDLYAAGRDGDVWHYNGTDWSPVDIPLPQMQITAICCAEDGFVYIVGRFGAILKGRGDRWETIKNDHQTDFSDIVSYQNTLYIASAATLWVLDDGSIKPYAFKGKLVPANYGHLYVNHGLMMSAGRSSAAIFDGKEWQCLFGCGGLDSKSSGHIIENLLGKIIEAQGN